MNRILSAYWVAEWTGKAHFSRVGYPTLIPPKKKIGACAAF